MNFFETISRRRSIREFTAQPIEEEKLKKILATANQAPSAGNLQAYEIFVVTDEAAKKKLVSITDGQEFVGQAPVVLVFFANPERSAVKYRERGEQLYCIQDATIACAYAQLAATELGLGSVWVGAFEDSQLKELLEIAEDLKPVAILPLGYPAEQPEPSTRRQLDDLAHRK